MADKTRVLLVDDSPFVRRAVQRMLEPLPEIEVVGSATNGREGVEMAQRLRPDVILLDIVMPELDGLEAIRRIMATAPTPIVILSSHAQPGADVTLEALDLGAVDFVSKTDADTRMDIYDLTPVIREKIRAAATSRVPRRSRPATPTAPAPVAPRTSAFEILALGASTGGPRALAAVLSSLPADFPAGVVVAQHMPPGFTSNLAERLDGRVPMTVREATDGEPIEPGVALIGVGGRQLKVERTDRLRARVPPDSDRLLHRPSVDELFRSVAEVVGERAVAVVLTGMGEDGAAGLAEVRAAGGRTFAESEESAVIYGMPRVARPHAERVLPLSRLGPAILRLIAGEGGA